MTESIWSYLSLCIAALFATIIVCRRGNSFGFPVAYMANLLLIHVPGAFAFAIAGDRYPAFFRSYSMTMGMQLTALGAICFVVGLWIARRGSVPKAAPIRIERSFVTFCVLGGWLLAFGLTPLRSIPSLGAALVFGSSVWMLGVMLGMARAFEQHRFLEMLPWIAAMLVYPVEVLIFGGFLGYGATAVIVVLSFLVIRIRRSWVALAIAPLLCFVGISLFVNYFEQRTFLRSVLWSEANFEARIDALEQTFSGMKPFDPYDRGHVGALAVRLNQNMFVAIAAKRLERGDLDYFKGRSFYDGLMSLVPRAIWADKPVYGGSPEVVAEVTGLRLNKNTSWGVGNILEFYINFGLWSLAAGMALLGWGIGRLDLVGYRRLAAGREADSLLYVLPAIALIQPNGSLVEIAGGAASALVAALGWRYAWRIFLQRRQGRAGRSRRTAIPPAYSRP